MQILKYKQDLNLKTAEYIFNFIKLNVSKQCVILLSCGSLINVYLELNELLKNHELNLKNLSVLLMDERVTPKNTQGSNEFCILQSGLIKTLQSYGGAFYPLYVEGQELNLNIELAAKLYTHVIESSNATLGVFGIGQDLHTAGIFPIPKLDFFKTYSTIISHTNLVSFGITNEFAQRLSVGLGVIAKMSDALVFVAGQNKENVLKTFLNSTPCDPYTPCSFIKQIANVTVCTNI